MMNEIKKTEVKSWKHKLLKMCMPKKLEYSPLDYLWADGEYINATDGKWIARIPSDLPKGHYRMVEEGCTVNFVHNPLSDADQGYDAKIVMPELNANDPLCIDFKLPIIDWQGNLIRYFSKVDTFVNLEFIFQLAKLKEKAWLTGGGVKSVDSDGKPTIENFCFTFGESFDDVQAFCVICPLLEILSKPKATHKFF